MPLTLRTVLKPLAVALSLTLTPLLSPIASATEVTVYSGVLPPFANGEDADTPGLAIEMVTEIVNRAGLELNLTYLPWARALKTTVSEPNSFVVPPVRTPMREADYYWAVELVPSNQLFVTVGDAVNSYEEAAALEKVAVLRGSIMEKILISKGMTNLHPVATTVQAVKLVKAGRADAWYGLDVETYGVLTAAGFQKSDFTIGASVLASEHWIASNHSFDADVVAALAKAREEMVADGTFKAIYDRYVR
ncbi:ABC transporter substrate-binding protein [Phaeobacter sp. B1627]|uniref:substrate-binding periplasmic protein n=1 Tax=Phaeobacter sp. B1627 TaxID=2583809 RepID=UPI00111B5548|nr:transporter substrate-binding domain-containing protein [Phaeobacter sp. B1627]TNJ40906.1 amino acid ABC transporter substrate-binding protein [Phaeobacter sp. B1627]